MRDEHDEPPIASKKKDSAACLSDVEGVPHTIVNSAFKVLNDTDIGRDDNDERATALRDELTKKFGSFWHVVSDTDDFAVACGATELPVQNGAHGETKRISMRFKKGTCEYEVWHHVAPFDRFGIGKMTWSALAVVYDAMARESNEGGGAHRARAKSGLDLGGVFDAVRPNAATCPEATGEFPALEPTPRAYQRQAVGWMLSLIHI